MQMLISKLTKKNILLSFSLLCLVSCAVENSSIIDNKPMAPVDIRENIAKNSQNDDVDSSVIAPNVGERVSVLNKTESATPQATKRHTVTEDKGPGGVVNRINVDNYGDVPNYYIQPSQGTSLTNPGLNAKPQQNITPTTWDLISW